jgi:hypothetical protein
VPVARRFFPATLLRAQREGEGAGETVIIEVEGAAIDRTIAVAYLADGGVRVTFALTRRVFEWIGTMDDPDKLCTESRELLELRAKRPTENKKSVPCAICGHPRGMHKADRCLDSVWAKGGGLVDGVLPRCTCKAFVPPKPPKKKSARAR